MHFVPLRALAVTFALALTACTIGGAPASNPLCTCTADQKYDDGTKSCVASADFTAPTACTDDGAAVCGCDQVNYASSCAAYTAGVEVQYGGACHAATTGGGGGGFGW